MKSLVFVLGIGLCLLSSVAWAEGGQPERPFRLFRPLNGHPVRQSVEMVPPTWLGSLSISMDGEGNASVYYYMVPPPPGPTYRFHIENIADENDPVSSVDGAFSNLHGMFGNLGGYFGRLTPVQPSPEEMARRRQEWSDFKDRPWAFPRFLRAYRHIPPDIARKVLQHQRKELTDRLFQVLDNVDVQETERFSADYEAFITCLTSQPWPSQNLVTHWLLHVKGDGLFYNATVQGK